MSQNKRIAMLMLCHVLPDQINNLIDSFDSNCFDFFLHVDKKSDIQPLIRKSENVFFVPDNRRVNVLWGSYSMIQASIELIQFAMQEGTYDYYWLCSGQDYPIKSPEEIVAFFKEKTCNFMSFSSSANNPINGRRNTRFDKRCEIIYPPCLIGKSVWQKALKRLYCIATGGTGHTFKIVRRRPPYELKLYFGSQWWCLNAQTVQWLMSYIATYREICDFYKHTLCPDESFFQTLVMASPYAEAIEPNLVYIDWSAGKNSPKLLDASDYEAMKASGKLLARKIDSERAPGLYQMLISEFGAKAIP